MTRQPGNDILLDHKDALDVYVRALLREDFLEPLAPPLPPVVQPRVEPRVEVPVAAPLVQSAPPPPKPATGSDIPQWGEHPFQAMLFKVSGLTLAVPLVELSGVQIWERSKVTPMPGHVHWYLGLMEYRGRSVPVVDTAHLVMPEDRRASIPPPEERVTRVVFIDEGKWGLACDLVAEVLTLGSDQVRWRTSRTRRQWLAGTVIEHMCAIIDPPAFARMLATGIEDASPDEEPAGTGVKIA